MLRILRSPESEALAAVVALCGRLQLTQTVPGLGETVAHRTRPCGWRRCRRWPSWARPRRWRSSRRRWKTTTGPCAWPPCASSGGRGYKGAQKRVEGIVLGKAVKEMDLTEKMAFFEAYGAIAGAAGIKPLSALLLPRGLLRMKEASETRACAAIALGKIRTPEAREIAPAGRRRQGSRGAERREPRAAGDRPHDHAGRADRRAAPSEGRLRQGGRALLLALYTALRSLKLYPVENATVQKALDDLDGAARALLALEADLEIRLAGDFIFVNATRLRLELDNYASFSHILAMLRAFSIGALRVHASANRREWQIFLSLLLSLFDRGDPDGRFEELFERLALGWGQGPRGRARRGAGARSRRRAGQGAGQADLLAGRGGHQGRDHRRSAGPRHQRQEGQARGADHRRPGPQQRDLAGRPHDDPRLRRVHVHPLGQRLHLLGGAGQEARASPGCSSTTSA